MNLQENPFAVLGVSPRDNRHTLLEKADEAALLNGAAVEDALASLLKMNQRVEADAPSRRPTRFPLFSPPGRMITRSIPLGCAAAWTGFCRRSRQMKP